MNITVLFSILVLAPLVGFLFNGLRFKSKNYQLAGIVASAASFISFVCSVMLFFKLTGLSADERSLGVSFFQWMLAGDFSVDAGLVVDPISSIMLLVITGVGTLIHIFSIGYMSHDERPSKYFAFLNLFLFNMLLLVLGDNLLVMFVGWEGVGLCSYLLIGFWFSDAEKAAAGMKAFITNRIGDAGFLLGIFFLFLTFGTVNFSEILSLLPETAELGWTGPLTLACLCLFVGATGKSAQIPLYVWLPDAMAGPTPVSALIHAATMVTAGVYMIIRLSGLFMLAPNVMFLIATIGALTALMGALIGLTQWDIKKVLAYSTVSQLGYMFLAVGVGAFIPALFHLMTHAFFKALMFLGSGSVIHSMDGEQDIRKMGALKKLMPITHITFCFGWLAIIGIPPFAGFFSKDEILWYSLASPMGHKFLWTIGAVGAVITAFYMTRLMALTFWGKSRVPKEIHPHESPTSMTFPLIVLAGLSLVGGWVGIPHIISALIPGHPANLLEQWVKPAVAPIELHGSASLEWITMGVCMAAIIASAYMAYTFYTKHTDIPGKIAATLSAPHKFIFNKFMVDEFYFAAVIGPLVKASQSLWFYVDINFIDKCTYWMTGFVKSCGEGARSFQNGNLQTYAFQISFGLIVLMSIILALG